MTELRRVSNEINKLSHMIKTQGPFVWVKCEEWSNVSTDVWMKNKKTLSQIYDEFNQPFYVRYADRFQELLLGVWVRSANFSAYICFLYGDPMPERDALVKAETYLLRGRQIPSKWLLSCAYTACKQTSEYLLSDRVQNKSDHKDFEKNLYLLFDEVLELRDFMTDIQTNYEGKIVYCSEPYCREPVPRPRKGRCPSCYNWVRRWQKNNPDELPVIVPKEIIVERHRIRMKHADRT